MNGAKHRGPWAANNFFLWSSDVSSVIYFSFISTSHMRYSLRLTTDVSYKATLAKSEARERIHYNHPSGNFIHILNSLWFKRAKPNSPLRLCSKRPRNNHITPVITCIYATWMITNWPRTFWEWLELFANSLGWIICCVGPLGSGYIKEMIKTQLGVLKTGFLCGPVKNAARLRPTGRTEQWRAACA